MEGRFMTDALSLALQKIADGDSSAAVAMQPASPIAPPLQPAPALQVTPAPLPTAVVEPPARDMAPPEILPMTARPAASAPVVPMPTVAQTAPLTPPPVPALRMETVMPESPAISGNRAAVAAGLARLAMPAAESAQQQIPLESPAATSSTPQLTPATTNVPVAARSSRSWIDWLAPMQEYRTILAAVVVVAVVAVVWNDTRTASVTEIDNSSAEINIEQLLEEFETADQRASERNARRARELAEQQEEPDFLETPEMPTSGVPSRQRAAVYSQESTTSERASDAAVYPDQNTDVEQPQPSIRAEQDEPPRPVRFTGRIQPME
jgi:hypothetical protein